MFDAYLKPAYKNDFSQNVLLLLNSDTPLSAQVADYYETARHFVNAQRLSYTTAEYLSLGSAGVLIDLAAVAEFNASHDIYVVIAMPGVPAAIHTGGLFYFQTESFFTSRKVDGKNTAYPLDFVRHCDQNSLYKRGSDYTALQNPSMTLSAPDGFRGFVIQSAEHLMPLFKSASLPAYIYTTDFATGYPVLLPASGGAYIECLSGRVGCPYGALNTYTETVRMIDDCVAAERAFTGIANKRFVLGFGDYTAHGIHQHQWYAWQMAKEAGMQCAYFIEGTVGTGGRRLPASVFNNLTGWLGQEPDYVSADVYAGTANIEFDLYLGSAVINDGFLGSGNTAYKNYYQSLMPRLGAWSFNFCSSGWQFNANAISRGASAGIGPPAEPLVSGLPEDGSIMALALQGFSLVEIAYLTGGKITTFGDPLYRPFPAVGLPDGEALSLQNMTPFRGAVAAHNVHAISKADHQFDLINQTPGRTAQWRG